MSCDFSPNTTIAQDQQYWRFEDSLSSRHDCMQTYLRPNVGGALMPWLYALFMLIFHLPTCIIRAVRWESAQYIALGLALFGIALTIQSYQGTSLGAETVLVWMPLTLLLDVGAMLQMVVLIIEKHGIRNLLQTISDLISKLGRKRSHMSLSTTEVEMDSGTLAQPALNISTQDHTVIQTKLEDIEANSEPEKLDLLRHSIVALFASFFLLLMVILQIMGLIYAVKRRNEPAHTVKWCSPGFREYSVAILMLGTCELYPVVNGDNSGISCIELPAQQQADWLTGTIVCLSASLIFQAMDVVLLRCAYGRLFRGVRMRRPWFSMFGGVLVLVILIVFGVFNAGRLPPGVSNIVWVFRISEQETFGTVCRKYLNPPGLRGMIIAWTDGLFDSWGSAYTGSSLRY